jgi:hypothetical protein
VYSAATLNHDELGLDLGPSRSQRAAQGVDAKGDPKGDLGAGIEYDD